MLSTFKINLLFVDLDFACRSRATAPNLIIGARGVRGSVKRTHVDPFLSVSLVGKMPQHHHLRKGELLNATIRLVKSVHSIGKHLEAKVNAISKNIDGKEAKATETPPIVPAADKKVNQIITETLKLENAVKAASDAVDENIVKGDNVGSSADADNVVLGSDHDTINEAQEKLESSVKEASVASEKVKRAIQATKQAQVFAKSVETKTEKITKAEPGDNAKTLQVKQHVADTVSKAAQKAVQVAANAALKAAEIANAATAKVVESGKQVVSKANKLSSGAAAGTDIKSASYIRAATTALLGQFNVTTFNGTQQTMTKTLTGSGGHKGSMTISIQLDPTHSKGSNQSQIMTEAVKDVAQNIVSEIGDTLQTQTSVEKRVVDKLLLASLLFFLLSFLCYVFYRVLVYKRVRERKLHLFNSFYIAFTHKNMFLLFLILMMYACSITMANLNKFIVSYWHGGYHVPLGMTSIHLFLKACFAYGGLWVLNRNKTDTRGNPVPILRPLDFDYFIRYVAPLGICTGLDIAMVNLAVVWLTVSSLVVVKTTGILWTLVFSIMVGLTDPTYKIVLACTIIVAGLVLANLGETMNGEVPMFPFMLALGGVIVGSVKSILVQIILQGWAVPKSTNKFAVIKGNPKSLKLTPLETIVYMAPGAVFVLFLSFLIFEYQYFTMSEITHMDIIVIIAFLLLGSVVVFGLTISELKFNMNTSCLTLDVAMTLRQLITILMAAYIFNDILTLCNMGGMLLVLSGVCYYTTINTTGVQEGETVQPPPEYEALDQPPEKEK